MTSNKPHIAPSHVRAIAKSVMGDFMGKKEFYDELSEWTILIMKGIVIQACERAKESGRRRGKLTQENILDIIDNYKAIGVRFEE